jgi:hypothetical protein
VIALAAPAPVYHNAAPVVWSHGNSTRFTITGVTIRLAQVNMSNALRIDSSAYFTVSNNTLIQGGSCVTSVQERFDSAVILYVSNSSDGWIQVREATNTTALWCYLHIALHLLVVLVVACSATSSIGSVAG